MKILYFTGTGNCLAVAKKFNAELLSIPQMLKSNNYDVEADAVGIIYPVYYNAVPNIVERYLRKCKIKTDYLFVIATYGSIAGGTLYKMRKLLEANGNHANYYEQLLMVDNFLPGFNIKDELSKIPQKNIEENLNRIIQEVSERKTKSENTNIIWKTSSFYMGSIGLKLARFFPKLYKVTNECTGCGICSKVCPVGNIIQNEKNKPVFKYNCESCLACVNNCPQNAIQLKIQKSKDRFRNSEVTLNEIISSNNILLLRQ